MSKKEKRYLQWGYESYKDTTTGEVKSDYVDLLNNQDQQIAELKAENAQLQQQLKDNTKQVCEKIREELSNVGKTYFEDEPYIEICIVKGILDQIEEGQ